MEKKKIKLKLSGNIKKSISSIEKAKIQGKNSVFIERKNNKFPGKKTFTPSVKSPSTSSKPQFVNKDFEKRKLAEQRATKRLKEETEKKDNRGDYSQ